MQCDLCGKRTDMVLNGVAVCKGCSQHGSKLTWRDFSPSGKCTLEPIEPEGKFRKLSPKKSNPRRCPKCGSNLHVWCGSAKNRWWEEQ